jgi:hypothetical protein
MYSAHTEYYVIIKNWNFTKLTTQNIWGSKTFYSEYSINTEYLKHVLFRYPKPVQKYWVKIKFDFCKKIMLTWILIKFLFTITVCKALPKIPTIRCRKKIQMLKQKWKASSQLRNKESILPYFNFTRIQNLAAKLECL